jgi:hypothetical protein
MVPTTAVPTGTATALPTPAWTAARLSLATALLPPTAATAATAFFSERRNRDEQARGNCRHERDFA